MKRIYHTWEKWECYPAGFYESAPVGQQLTEQECTWLYYMMLSDLDIFESALQQVITEWKFSCEHYLSNKSMNRIAWLGQASACILLGIPACFRGGFNLLSEQEQEAANLLALDYLNKWLAAQGEPSVTLDGAGVKAQVNLY